MFNADKLERCVIKLNIETVGIDTVGVCCDIILNAECLCAVVDHDALSAECIAAVDSEACNIVVGECSVFNRCVELNDCADVARVCHSDIVAADLRSSLEGESFVCRNAVLQLEPKCTDLLTYACYLIACAVHVCNIEEAASLVGEIINILIPAVIVEEFIIVVALNELYLGVIKVYIETERVDTLCVLGDVIADTDCSCLAVNEDALRAERIASVVNDRIEVGIFKCHRRISSFDICDVVGSVNLEVVAVFRNRTDREIVGLRNAVLQLEPECTDIAGRSDIRACYRSVSCVEEISVVVCLVNRCGIYLI